MDQLLIAGLIFLAGVFAGMGWGYVAGLHQPRPRRRGRERAELEGTDGPRGRVLELTRPDDEGQTDG